MSTDVTLNMPGQVKLSGDLKQFIKKSTGNYGKAKMVLQKNKFYVESPYPEVLKILLKVRVITPRQDNLLREVMRETLQRMTYLGNTANVRVSKWSETSLIIW